MIPVSSPASSSSGKYCEEKGKGREKVSDRVGREERGREAVEKRVNERYP